MSNVQCPMIVRLRHLFNNILIPSLVIGYLSLVILPVGCGDLEGEGSVASIEVSPSRITIGVNQYYSFSAQGRNSVGTLISISPAWKVNGNIGTISANGMFKAGSAEGTGTVEAAYNSLSASSAVTITGNGALEGRVTDQSGKILNGISVYIKGHPLYIETTGQDGKYSISNIVPGTYEARINATTLYQVISQEVGIVSGETYTWNPILQFTSGIPPFPTTTFSP